jgi:hypothetical protein
MQEPGLRRLREGARLGLFKNKVGQQQQGQPQGQSQGQPQGQPQHSPQQQGGGQPQLFAA